MKKIYLLFALLAGTAIFAFSPAATPATVSRMVNPVKDTLCEIQLNVTVRDASLGNPVPGANLILKDASENVLETKIADADGRASFTVACSRDYTVGAYGDGFNGNSVLLSVPPDSKSPVLLDIPLQAIGEMIKSSGGHLLDFKVRVFNPKKTPLNIRFGPDSKNMQTIAIAGGAVWESPAFPTDQKLQLWVTTNKVVKKYVTLPGKAYQLVYDKVKKVYGIEEVVVEE
ncbi:carboxypeptidase-like regulatory domain-containing protein [Flavobacterium pallidum]|uniref:Carboxypeptidase regulatory-like domain-containing protein n=1 Tax=Flavobacterium pallidum TaxID=2172098 RepID=A0A2S1SHD8_9FLAO|nr:carboxypeptidase-like regulatory domain-containing protein [Flavobacterium pallidum]AWI25795.1 hypothetical protein HYN49_07705 [Flavobacterium pallidum]